MFPTFKTQWRGERKPNFAASFAKSKTRYFYVGTPSLFAELYVPAAPTLERGHRGLFISGGSMAWIESHQELRHHPKLSAVCGLLSADPAHMVGHLHFLWWWCMDYALDGNLSKYSSQQIADAAGWHGKSEPFVNALIESGFLDRTESLVLKIHDWLEFCGELVLKRLDRRQEKNKKIVSFEQRSADNIRRTAENGRQNLPNPAERLPTVPNRTVPNPTQPNLTTLRRFQKPTAEEVMAYAKTISFELDGQAFIDHYESKGWMIGKSPMKSWQAAVRTWKSRRSEDGQRGTHERGDQSNNARSGDSGKFSDIGTVIEL